MTTTFTLVMTFIVGYILGKLSNLVIEIKKIKEINKEFLENNLKKISKQKASQLEFLNTSGGLKRPTKADISKRTDPNKEGEKAMEEMLDEIL